jgi:ribosome recycling factor
VREGWETSVFAHCLSLALRYAVDTMPDARISSFQADAEKVIHFLLAEFAKLQTGRANASLVEHLEVDAYGQPSPLKSIAGVSIADGRTIVIQPWDRSVLAAVEKAIRQSDMGVNPVNDGVVIRLTLPPMTEERRQQLVKIVHKLAEEARISVRQSRQKAHDLIKQDPNETLRNSLQDQLQKEVDKANGRIDEVREKKEEEVMKV